MAGGFRRHSLAASEASTDLVIVLLPRRGGTRLEVRDYYSQAIETS